MKRKTKLFENKLKLYQNPIIKKNNSFILKPFKIKSYFEKSEEKNNSDNQSLNLKILKLKIKPFKLNIIHFKSYTNVPKEKKIKKLNILLNKCQSGINEGHNIEKEFEKLYFKDYEEKEKINKEKNQLNMLDILNEQKNRKVEKINFNEKYKAIEEAKFRELKKEIRLKVSESFAFSNRKEYYTIASLRADGFDHRIGAEKFNDWFYSSLLIEDRENIIQKRRSIKDHQSKTLAYTCNAGIE